MQFRKQEMNTLVARISVQCKSETDYVSHAVGFDNGRDKWNGMHFYFFKRFNAKDVCNFQKRRPPAGASHGVRKFLFRVV